jgi:hypothetical protein
MFIENKEGFPKDILIRFKNSGGNQHQAKNVCEKLRIVYAQNEILEDKVLNTMDIAVGWCNPEMNIWD